MAKITWNKIESKVKSFQLGDEPEVIHVIKTGFRDRFMIVYEDAFELNLGKVIFLTQQQVEQQFNIEI